MTMRIPPARLLHELLTSTADASPDKVALVVEGTPHTYAELRDRAQRLAGALRQRGLSRGDRVAIYMANTFECAVGIYGALLAGGVFVVVNPQTKHGKLAHIVADCGARIVLTDSHLHREFEQVLAHCESVTAILCSGRLDAVHMPELRGLPVLEPFWEVVEDTLPLSEKARTIPLDLASLIYTSGTTGNPKGVMMTHQSMVFTIGSLLEYLRLSDAHRILNVLPLSFDYGLYQLLMSVAAGATLVLERSFAYPAAIFQRMREQEGTVFPGVPTIFAMFVSQHERKPLCFPSVERITNTAAALPRDYLAALKEIFPNALIFKMYGLTECKRVAYLEPELLDARPASVGGAIPGTEVFILSPEGEPVPVGETGILHVRGPHVMLGYWNLPDKSAELLRPGKLPGERILNTTDWFRQDEDGFLYFVGRSDDIIKTRGEKVAPVEIENVLHGMPGIQEAAVVPVPDEILGSAIRAYLTLVEGAEVTEQEVKRYCAAQLESFMIPQEVIFLPKMPKTASGKISKQGLSS